MLFGMFQLHKRRKFCFSDDVDLMDASPQDYLNSLRCTKLPPTLFRVQHANSQASFNDTYDLVAKLHDRVPRSLYELRAALSRHLKWGYARADSYFISTFEEYREALEWARARKRVNEDEKVTIYKIRTGQMGSAALVFKADRMMRRLNLESEVDGGGAGGVKMREGEYVILNRVPARAISLLKDDVELEVVKAHSPPTRMGGAFARESTRQTPFDRCTTRRRSYVYNSARLSSTDALFASYMARLNVEQKESSRCESVLELTSLGSDKRYAAGGEREEPDRVDSLVSIIEEDSKSDKLQWKPLPMRPKSKLIQAVEADLGLVGDGRW